MKKLKISQLTLTIIIIAITFISQTRSQKQITQAILNDQEKKITFGFSELFEIQYDNSKRQSILEFTLKIDKSSIKNFDDMCFLLLASLAPLKQEEFVQDILDVKGTEFYYYSNSKNVQIIAADLQGLSSAKKTLAVQTIDKAGNSKKIYYYVFGPYQFAQKQALLPPNELIPPQFSARFTIKNKMTCQNSCSNQGKCVEEEEFAYCICYPGYIDRDCSKRAQPIKIGDESLKIEMKKDSKIYLYFDITEEDYEYKKNLIIDVGFTSNTIGFILQSQVDFTNLQFIMDYLYWLLFRGLTSLAGQVSDERRQYAFNMDESVNQQRIILLVQNKDETVLDISVYKFEVSSSNPSLLILYIILGVLGFIVLLYILYIVRRTKNLRRNNQQLALNLQQHQVAANEAGERRVQQQTHKLTQEQVDEYIPTQKYDSHLKSMFKNDQCAVCLEEFKINNDLVKSTICQHIFHSECLSIWLNKQQNCPFCRQELTLQKLKEYKQNPAAYQQISGIKVNQKHVQYSIHSNRILPDPQSQTSESNQQQNTNINNEQISQPIGQNTGQIFDEEQVHMNNNRMNHQDNNKNAINTELVNNM